jgi:hypothetical protein
VLLAHRLPDGSAADALFDDAWSARLPRMGAASQKGLPTMSAGSIRLQLRAVRFTSTTVPLGVSKAMN